MAKSKTRRESSGQVATGKECRCLVPKGSKIKQQPLLHYSLPLNTGTGSQRFRGPDVLVCSMMYRCACTSRQGNE